MLWITPISKCMCCFLFLQLQQEEEEHPLEAAEEAMFSREEDSLLLGFFVNHCRKETADSL